MMKKVNDIKFRAWDIYDSTMFRVDILDWKNYSVNLVGGDICSFDEVELMQYTGVKDKNGVDIYEGDILNGVYYGVTGFEEKIKGEVYYTSLGTWDCCSILLGDLNETCEVIGNIYNN